MIIDSRGSPGGQAPCSGRRLFGVVEVGDHVVPGAEHRDAQQDGGHHSQSHGGDEPGAAHYAHYLGGADTESGDGDAGHGVDPADPVQQPYSPLGRFLLESVSQCLAREQARSASSLASQVRGSPSLTTRRTPC